MEGRVEMVAFLSVEEDMVITTFFVVLVLYASTISTLTPLFSSALIFLHTTTITTSPASLFLHSYLWAYVISALI